MVELLFVLSLIGILARLAAPSLIMMRDRASRHDATSTLSTIWRMQRAYYFDKQQYAPDFDTLGFQLDGATRVSSSQWAGKVYTFQLSQPNGSQSFYCSATANLDDDPWPDVLIVEDGT